MCIKDLKEKEWQKQKILLALHKICDNVRPLHTGDATTSINQTYGVTYEVLESLIYFVVVLGLFNSQR